MRPSNGGLGVGLSGEGKGICGFPSLAYSASLWSSLVSLASSSSFLLNAAAVACRKINPVFLHALMSRGRTERERA